MAESTLSVTYDDMRLEIAEEIGLGQTVAEWPAAEVTRVDRYLKAALRQVYAPAIGPSVPAGFTWSFLTKSDSVPTVDGTEWYVMDDNFAGLVIERLTFEPASLPYAPVELIDIGEYAVRRLDFLGQKTRPRYCTLSTDLVDVGGTKYFRHYLGVIPIPDAVYTLAFFFRVLPDNISATLYPYGGMEIGETLLASCRSIVERQLQGGPGPKHDEFLRILSSAINIDLVNRPSRLGRNLDPNVGRPHGQYRIAKSFKVGGVEV